MAIGAGAGGFVVRLKVQREVESLLQNIEEQILAGQAAGVAQEIRSVRPGSDPDTGTFPVLDLLPALNDRLSGRTSDTKGSKPVEIVDAGESSLR